MSETMNFHLWFLHQWWLSFKWENGFVCWLINDSSILVRKIIMKLIRVCCGDKNAIKMIIYYQSLKIMMQWIMKKMISYLSFLIPCFFWSSHDQRWMMLAMINLYIFHFNSKIEDIKWGMRVKLWNMKHAKIEPLFRLSSLMNL